jgi:hypothetical protein
MFHTAHFLVCGTFRQYSWDVIKSDIFPSKRQNVCKKRHVQIHLQERNGQLGENFRPKKEGGGGVLRNQFSREGFHDMSIYEKFTQ